MVDYNKALARPFQDWGKLLLGCVFAILPIVNFILVGYGLECARTAYKKKYQLPEWKNFGDLFVKGLLSTIISIIYMIIPIILFITAFFKVFPGLFSGASVNPIIDSTTMTLFIIGVILMIISVYVVYSAVIRYVLTNKFSEAFTGEVFRKAFTGKYFITWLIMIIYAIVLGLIAFAIGLIIPIVPTLVISWIITVTFYTAFGELFAELK